MPAMAQQENMPAEDETVEGEIIVFGRGETRQVQELTSKDLLILALGTSPLKAIEKLPSVNCYWPATCERSSYVRQTELNP